jgi:hypothetical protein
MLEGGKIMGRLIIEMLGQDKLKILSLREVPPKSLKLKIEGNSPQDCAEITVDFQEFIRLLNIILANRKNP